MSAATENPRPSSLSRVSSIPLVESCISTLDTTLSSSRLLRTPYAISLGVYSRVIPYVEAASAHYPFAPAVRYGDAAANKTLDMAQERWPYPFEKNPEQVWSDVRAVTDERVVKPAYGVAKSVDQSLTPLVDRFTFVVKKIDSDAEGKAQAVCPEDYQLQRVYALLVVLKDDLVKTADAEQHAAVQNIHTALSNATQNASAILSSVRARSEDTVSRGMEGVYAVVGELDKINPLLSSLTSKTSSTIKTTSADLREVAASSDPAMQKATRMRQVLEKGIREVAEDVVAKVHSVVEDIRSNASSSSASSPSTSSASSDVSQ